MTRLISEYRERAASEVIISRTAIASPACSASAPTAQPVIGITGICPRLLGKPMTSMVKLVLP